MHMEVFPFKDAYWVARGNSKLLSYTGPALKTNLDSKAVKRFLRKKKAWGAIWNYDHDYANDGLWYRCICDTKGYDESCISSKNVRHNLHRSLKRCTVRRVEYPFLAENGYDVYAKASSRYTNFKLEPKGQFSRQMLRHCDIENAEAFGAFVDDKLIAYMTVFICGDSARGDTAAFDPDYSNAYPMYALYFRVAHHYVNERGCREFDRGSRPLVHETNVDDFLLRLGYRKAYCRMGLYLAAPVRIVLRAVRILRKFLKYMLPSRYCLVLEGLLKAQDITRATTVPASYGGITIGSTDKYSAFVTYGWCRMTYAVVLSLGRRGIDVHVSDASSVAMSRYSRYCKSYVKVPDFFVEPDRYFEATCEALKKTGAKVLLPAHEDVGIFCRRKNELPPGVCVALPDWDNYRVAEDKLAVLDVAAQAGCPTPLTIKVESLSQLEDLSRRAGMGWPVVLKTHIGNSAKGVRVVHNRDELLAGFKELVETFHLPQDRWPFVQQFLPGDAAGVCMLYQNGRCVASFAERYLRCKEPGKFGTSTLREPFENRQLILQAISVMDRLKWHGVAHIDFVADKNGQYRLIEVNPRLWGALALSVFVGVDFPYLWYLMALGESVNEPAGSKYPPIKCRWIVGDCLAFLERVERGMPAEAVQILAPQLRCYHDDFVLSDPLPLAFELMDYVAKFLKSGGSVNPVTGGMVR